MDSQINLEVTSELVTREYILQLGEEFLGELSPRLSRATESTVRVWEDGSYYDVRIDFYLLLPYKPVDEMSLYMLIPTGYTTITSRGCHYSIDIRVSRRMSEEAYYKVFTAITGIVKIHLAKTIDELEGEILG